MKILQIINKSPFPARDGGALAVLAHTIGFLENGHSVTILCLSTPKHPFLPENVTIENKNFRIIPFTINTNFNIFRFLKNLFFSDIPYNAERFINKEFSDYLKIFSENNHFDIIQLEGLYLCPYISVLNNKSVISLRAHNIEHEIWQRNMQIEKNIFKKFYLKILAARLKKMETGYFDKVDCVVPITERDKEIIQKNRTDNKIFVSPYSINTKFAVNKKQNPEYHIGFLGSLDWFPNTEGLKWFVLNCWPQIKQQNPDVKFIVAGRNARKEFVNFIVDNNIDFAVNVADSNEFLNNVLLVIVPLFSGSGMRVKIIEAMANAKAIIATHVAVEGIGATHNENIVISDDATDFSNQILNLLTNDKLRNNLETNAQNFIGRHFDLYENACRLIAFYQNLLN